MPECPLGSTHGRMTSGMKFHYRTREAHTQAIISLGKHTQSEGVNHEMPSLPLDNTHGRTILGVACLHCLWIAHTVKRHQALEDRMGLGQHKWPDDVGLHMPSSPFGITHAYTVGRQRALHAIITLRQHTRLDGVGRCIPSSPLENIKDKTTSGVHTRLDGVRRGIPSSPLENIHDKTMSVVEGHNRQGEEHTHTQPDDIGRGIPSSLLGSTHSRMTSSKAYMIGRRRARPLGNTHDWMTLGVALHNHPRKVHTVERRRGMPSLLLENIHDHSTSGLASYHLPCEAHKVKKRRAWHDIIALMQHTQSEGGEHCKPSSPLKYKHGRTILNLACLNRLLIAHIVSHTVGLCRSWHDCIAHRHHTWSNDIERCMPSSPLGSTPNQMRLGKEKRSNRVKHGMTSSTLDNTHNHTTSGEVCHHRPWTSHTVRQRRAWHAHMALSIAHRMHTWSDDIERCMPSSPLGSTPNLMTLGVAYDHYPLIACTEKWLNGVEHDRPSSTLDNIHSHTTSSEVCHHRPWTAHGHKWSYDTGRDMPSSPLGSTHGKIFLGLACPHGTWEHTQSDDIDRCMPSSPLGSTLFWMTSSVTFHHRPWEAHTVGRRRQGMPSLLLETIHGWTTSGVASYYRPCIEHTIKCCWAWHACIALRQPTRSDNVGRGMPQSPLDSMYTWTTLCMHDIIALGLYTWSDDIGRGMPECPLGSTHGRTTSGMTFHYRLRKAHTGSTQSRKASIVKCHHRHWTTHTFVQYWVWHVFNAFGLQTLSDDVRRCMTAWALGNINGKTTSDFKCHHRPWVSHTVAHTVGRHRALLAIITLRQHTQLDHGSIHGWMVSGMAFHHCPWKTYTIRLRGAWHAIIIIGKNTRSDNHKQSDDISCGIQSSPLGSTHDRTTSSVACHYQPLRAYTIGRRRARYVVIAL
uniref:Uncharacterized protein n=1 Tax=Solanum lycopersicum TaxID=4081 RepID=A0A3Q7FJY0_SOLLC